MEHKMMMTVMKQTREVRTSPRSGSRQPAASALRAPAPAPALTCRLRLTGPWTG